MVLEVNVLRGLICLLKVPLYVFKNFPNVGLQHLAFPLMKT